MNFPQNFLSAILTFILAVSYQLNAMDQGAQESPAEYLVIDYKRVKNMPNAMRAAIVHRHLNALSDKIAIGSHISEAIYAAEQALEIQDTFIQPHALDLLATIVSERRKGVNEATQAAQRGITSSDTQVLLAALNCFEVLADREFAIPETIKACQQVLKESSDEGFLEKCIAARLLEKVMQRNKP